MALPFHYLPEILSGGEIDAARLLVLTDLTLLLSAAGPSALQHRDVG